jgi:hypothetical protein
MLLVNAVTAWCHRHGLAAPTLTDLRG